MTSNYDRSKTIISKTTKNYHPHADDPLLLIICRKERMKSHYLCIIVHWKYVLPRQLVSNFSCLSLEIVKLAFHWRWINFCLCCRLTCCCERDDITWIYHNRFRSSSGQLLTQKCCFFFSFSGQAIARKMLS